jgi:Zn-dependent protease
MLFQVQETGYEIRFQVLGVPVMVHPYFWLMALILFGNDVVRYFEGGNPLVNLVVCLGVVFCSILVHEMGHVAMMAWYRMRARVVLYAMGGYATPVGGGSAFRRGMWDQILIAFAGPLAQFVLLGLILLLGYGREFPVNPVISWDAVFYVATVCNLVWPIFNLLPILPLDGGRICQGFTRIFQGHYQGDITALWISIIAGGVLAVLLFQNGRVFTGVFLVYITVHNFMELQQGSPRW